MSRPTIILTGFGSFPGVEHNATAELVPELADAARGRFSPYRVIDCVLPVEWNRAPDAVNELLAANDAVLALHFGVSHHASGLQIETVGRNIRAQHADACGEIPSAVCVIDDGPDTLVATLPAEAIVTRLGSRGIACYTSTDAGGYLCNTVLYHSLTAAAARSRPFMSGFVHLPAGLSRDISADDVASLTWNEAIEGSLDIIATCLAAID